MSICISAVVLVGTAHIESQKGSGSQARFLDVCQGRAFRLWCWYWKYIIWGEFLASFLSCYYHGVVCNSNSPVLYDDPLCICANMISSLEYHQSSESWIGIAKDMFVCWYKARPGPIRISCRSRDLPDATLVVLMLRENKRIILP